MNLVTVVVAAVSTMLVEGTTYFVHVLVTRAQTKAEAVQPLHDGKYFNNGNNEVVTE